MQTRTARPLAMGDVGPASDQWLGSAARAIGNTQDAGDARTEGKR